MSLLNSIIKTIGIFPNRGSSSISISAGNPETILSGPAKGLLFDSGRKNADVFTSGSYEKPVQKILFSLLFNGSIFYDIGANTGFFTLLAAKAVNPYGVVYAFEPVPGNYSLIETNSRLNGFSNISIQKTAVSNFPARRDLFLTKDIGGATLKGVASPPDRLGVIKVDTVSIDSLISAHRIKPPDVVKIDVEGAEFDVLQGMTRTIEKNGPTMIIEVDDATCAGCEKKLKRLRRFLEKIGYSLYFLPDSYKNINWQVKHLLAVRL